MTVQTSTEGRKRGGQPKPAEQRKRNSLTFRARDDLRARLQERADAAGRSLSEQIEHMLETALVSEGVATEVASLRDEVRALAARLHPARS
ncbi:hypothetical protein SAMN02799631_04351 [Methylobacterium sp. 174MFSha1.1]|uniref:hypothetical protein n=1 Tax=Methylobacterium sp. 174MFSha1.1 TaxID=1502749 RepID=UPI0008DF43D2|nr:hypothetical protein [Methylobacterium sp. 174MFSha1.1]SFV06088.1 hypothetical protein SAMN02799631_04351 [Methylobacterium sp. 174MFSha1.1]